MASEIDSVLARVTDGDIRTFEEDGAVVLRGLYEKMWIEWLGDDAVYGERQAEVEPRIEGRAFRAGERLTDPAIFPKVWPREQASA